MLVELDDVHGFVEHVAPGGSGFHDAQAEDGEGGFAEDVAGDAKGGGDDDVAERVGEDVTADDSGVVQADGAGGLHEIHAADRLDHSANDDGKAGPADQGEDQDDREVA